MCLRLGLLLPIAALLLASCGNDADESPVSSVPGPAPEAGTAVPNTSAPVASSRAPETSTSEPAGDGALADITALFAAVPNDPAYLSRVFAVELNAATAAAGATRPPLGAAIDDPASDAWIRAFAGPNAPRPQISLAFGSAPLELDVWRTQFGFSLFETSASATFVARDTSKYWRPTQLLSLYLVDVDAATIDAAVRSDPIWSGDLVDKQAGGTPYYFWTADEIANMERASPPRTAGVGGTMAVLDHVVIRAHDEDESSPRSPSPTATRSPTGATSPHCWRRSSRTPRTTSR